MVFKFIQSENEKSPIFVRLAGRVKIVRPEQPENAELSIEVRDVEKLMLLIAEQFKNAKFPIVETVFGTI